ncbi:MAG: AAA family ATPase [Aristaeellaceae bacterium]
MAQRILVVGCPGSGKSTLARRLAEKTGLPLDHLDSIDWRDDSTYLTREELVEVLRPILASPRWIIDGNYNGTMPLRAETCEEVIFLDDPVEVCLAGVRARLGTPRADTPWLEKEEDPAFMDFIRRYATESRPKVLALMAAHPDMTFPILRSREEAEALLARL